MTRKITTILLALALCLTLLPVGAGAASTTSGSYTLTSNDSNQLLCNNTPVASTSKNDWVAWEYNDSGNPSKYINNLSGYVLNGGTAGATYTLGADVTINAPLIIEGNVTLDLNGHVLKYGGTTNNSVIVVTSGAYFKLVGGSNASHTLHYTVDADGKWTFGTGDSYPNTITLTGGIITGGTGSDCSYTASNLRITQYFGGGVFVGHGATFEMTGGNIVDCSVSSAANGYSLGGGVYMGSNATFKMTGSSIVGCSSIQSGGLASGGGVYAPEGTNNANGNKVTITDSSIIGCTASGQGGGVYVGNHISLTVTDSSITSCTASGQGGGVLFAGGDATFTMEGSSTISGCKAEENGNGVFLWGGTMDARSGSVYGGVYLYNANDAKLTNTSTAGSTIFYAENGNEAISKAPAANDGDGAGKIEGKRVKFMDGTALYAETIAENNGNGTISEPIAPTNEGKHFFGWYTAETNGTKWNFANAIGDTNTLYARWHTLTHVSAKAATVGVAGNIEYWYCSTCKAYFSDANGTKKINDEADTVIAALPHRTYRVSTEPIESPKTADIGVALYAVMALTSCTGTALVVRGRKRK